MGGTDADIYRSRYQKPSYSYLQVGHILPRRYVETSLSPRCPRRRIGDS